MFIASHDSLPMSSMTPAARSASLRLLLTVAVIWAGTMVPASAHADAEKPMLTDTDRLALGLGRRAHALLLAPTLNETFLNISRILLDEAVALSPNNEHLWRLQHDYAALVEDVSRKRRSLQRLRELAPNDTVVHLRLIQLSVEQHQTAGDRIRAYESLLDGSGGRSLDPAIASRLAYDLALLYQRVGNTEQFAHWLGRATALDQSNQPAAALAAGFFRQYVDDPFAEAELLINLLLSNPVERESQLLLAAHLMNHGAYQGASRVLSMTVMQDVKMNRLPGEALVSDAAMSHWGNGDVEIALRAIRTHQSRLNELFRLSLRQENPDLDPIELARRRAPLPVDIATVYAVIAHSAGSEYADSAIESLHRSYQRALGEMTDVPNAVPDGEKAYRAALLKLEYAWLLLWLDQDLEAAGELLEQVQSQRPLSDRAVARFDGWIALREGSADRAIELLRPLAESDAAAHVGLAVALLKTGHRRDAARELLALARSQPGTLIGVWSADQLHRLLGRRAPMAELPRQLDELVTTIPQSIDRLADQPTSGVSLRILPASSTNSAFEPLLVNLELHNHLPIPVSIGRDSPIQPNAVLLPSLSIPGVRTASRQAGIIVGIDHRLRLRPRERIIVPVDLRLTSLGAAQEYFAIDGALIRVLGILNPYINQFGATMPGLLGSEHESIVIRVDGVRTTQAWLEQVLEMMVEHGGASDTKQLAFVGYRVAQGQAMLNTLPPSERQQVLNLSAALFDAFREMNPHAQAWLLSALPRITTVWLLRDAVRESNDPIVQFSYLLFALDDANDPVLAAARRSEHAGLRELAQIISRADDLEELLEVEDNPLDAGMQDSAPPQTPIVPGQ